MRFVLFVILIVLTGCAEPIGDKKTQPSDGKKTIASVELTDLNGQPVKLEQLKGKTIFLNFWATWCKPCIREMPSIERARQLLEKNGVVFLLASNENPDQIREFKQQYPFNLNYVRLINLEELGIDGLPTTYIYDPKGENVFAETGFRKWDDSANIEMILKINSRK